MDSLFHLAGAVIALLLLLGSFAALFNPGYGLKLFKALGLALVVLLVLPSVLLELLGNGDALRVLPALLLLSVGAYFVREHRLRRSRRRRERVRIRGAERKPILPWERNGL